MENVNVVLARDVLLNKVWGYETEVETKRSRCVYSLSTE